MRARFIIRFLVYRSEVWALTLSQGEHLLGELRRGRAAGAILWLMVLAGCDPAASSDGDGVSDAASPDREIVVDESTASAEARPASQTEAAGSDDGLSRVIPAIRPQALVEELRLDVEGLPTAALRWTDANGDNVAVLSEASEIVEGGEGDRAVSLDNRYLFGDHFILPSGEEPRVLRHVQDGVQECEYDVTAEFLWGSFRVTDADADGIGEVTFAYELACRSDVSPQELKLLALEDGDKYIIRGFSWSSRAMREAGTTGEPLPEGVPEPEPDRWPTALWEQTRQLYDEAAIR